YSRNEEIPSYRLYANNYSKDDKRGTIPLSGGMSYTEHLEEQLSFKGLPDRDRMIGQYIIGSLDNDGYLRRDTQSIADDIAFATGQEIETAEIDKVLAIIQTFEPHGTGARDLREALLLQLVHHRQSESVKDATTILNNHFDAFVKKHYDKIIARMGIDEERFKNAVDVIVGLQPKPANLYNEGGQSEPTIQIIPDFILDNSTGQLELSLNRNNIPDIKINNSYVKMLEEIARGSNRKKNEGDTGGDAQQFLKQKLDSARWFMSAIKQRNATLLLTMHTILEYQKEYFETGDETNLKPMILKDIAEKTGLDVSTISRVVNSKYIQTPFGIYSLKYFFSEAMQTSSGEEVSSREIKTILSECVANENKRKPMTDEALMDVLNDKGYKIARRTVAKYREMLGIPVARMRKEY
ncbi:MAG: RNA polymerase factor sigma-54, partial [Rikenellaceae bacterium]|nr:RNA polymerase factor sigma-54 [Rikenellaceae bacterium]